MEGKVSRWGLDRNDSTPYTDVIHDCRFDDSNVYNYAVVVNANGVVFSMTHSLAADLMALVELA